MTEVLSLNQGDKMAQCLNGITQLETPRLQESVPHESLLTSVPVPVDGLWSCRVPDT